jgi:hypothetical protein
MSLPCLVVSLLFRAIQGAKQDDRVGRYTKRSRNAMSIREGGCEGGASHIFRSATNRTSEEVKVGLLREGTSGQS